MQTCTHVHFHIFHSLAGVSEERHLTIAGFCSSRVATNLEYSRISLSMENSGNSVQPQRKIVRNKVFLVSHSNICVKQLLTW